ncbi:cobalamin biosynthesis protein CobE [Stutzerimonas nosocomialis]|uniref:cobalamin biosynthesis protein n=1 Tax=Stutzerimonas nosocomialis TaxID=1056496 RepID=UPI001108B811|nr:cobalamin biosynthesis protein [Stutzerimonas nosocomialis]TLX55601.1 cobalamin biosynthesis protein CobE [Stutzerimonas nosocomialis]
MNSPLHVAGLGCRRGCSMDALLALLQAGLQAHGLRLEQIASLATSTHKRDEPGLLRLADHLGLPLALFSAEQLQPYQHRLSAASPRVLAITGSAGIAEACALAQAHALSGSEATLLGPKRSSPVASLAIASSPPLPAEPA